MPKVTQPRKTWQYTKEFKVKAVKLSLLDGIQVKQVAEGLDIHPFMLSRWRKEYRDGNLHGGQKQMTVKKTNDKISSHELKENLRLKKEIKKLKKENGLLKKWQRYLAEQHQSNLDSSKDTEK